MLEWLRVVWLTPAMDALFTGPAGDRRRFLDRLVLAIDPHHGQRALDYEKAMRGRNRLLVEDSRDARLVRRDRGADGRDRRGDRRRARGDGAAARAMVERAAGRPARSRRPTSALAGERSRRRSARLPAVDVEEAFRALLAESRWKDRAAGRTLEGPHRSDLLVRHRQKAMAAELCSTGEQKALLIGIVLAHARAVRRASGAGADPAARRDRRASRRQTRRAALFEILEGLGCQAFMTGTEAALFSSLAGRAQFLTVDHGTVSARTEPGLTAAADAYVRA